MLLTLATALAGGIEPPDFEGDAPETPLDLYEAERLHCVQLKERYDVQTTSPGVYVEGVGMVEAGGWALQYNVRLQRDLGLSDDDVARFDVACGGVRTGSISIPDRPVR